MARSLNKVTLIGNLGKDPEIRTMSDNKEIASFSIATSETWKDKQTNEKKEKTEWHKVVVFSENTVTLVKLLKKGSSVYIEGTLQTRKWTDSNGVEKYTTEIILQNYNSKLIILDNKSSSDFSGESNNEYSASNRSSTSQNFNHNEDDDEIPF